MISVADQSGLGGSAGESAGGGAGVVIAAVIRWCSAWSRALIRVLMCWRSSSLVVIAHGCAVSEATARSTVVMREWYHIRMTL